MFRDMLVGLLILIVLLTAFLVACDGGPSPVETTSEPLRGAVELGKINSLVIYRFTDGDTTCYIASGYYGLGVDCLD